MRVRSPRRLRLAASLVLFSFACASGQRCGHRPVDEGGVTTTTTTTTTGSATTAATGESAIAAIEGDVLAVLRATYGQAQRGTSSDAPGSTGTVTTVSFGLGRKHARGDAESLRAGLVGRGFEVDRVLDEETSTAIFAARGDASVSLTIDVDASEATLTAERP